MEQLTSNLLYLDREDWKVNITLPRLGYHVPRGRRTHGIMHHTVIIDNDATPNLWESHDEIKARMRQLQVIRPDLGLDVPYNDVGFLMAGGKLVVCEGRGQDRTGAHTRGHNTEGYALALEGNFELAREVGPWVPALSSYWGWLKYQQEMRNLGVVKPLGGSVFGHLDFASTACPGWQVMAEIKNITFKKEEPVMEYLTEAEARAVGMFLNAAAAGLMKRPLTEEEKTALVWLLTQ